MEGKRVAVVENDTFGKVKIELGVLRISYAQKLIVAVAVPVASRCLGKTIEQVTGYFNTGFDLKTIGPRNCISIQNNKGRRLRDTLYGTSLKSTACKHS